MSEMNYDSNFNGQGGGANPGGYTPSGNGNYQ